MKPRRLIAVVGPTGAGKSELAIRIAGATRGEVISCDSVSVYRGFDIGSGKPSAEERARTPHHLVDARDMAEEWTAQDFADGAARAIDDIGTRGGQPIVCGGTGLYLTALLRGLFPGGEQKKALRARLQALATKRGNARLHRLLARVDPACAARTRPEDGVRVIRALEVFFGTGRPLSEMQRARRPAFEGETLLLGLTGGDDPELGDRRQLRKRIESRVRSMLDRGLVDETRGLIERWREAGRGAPLPRVFASIGYAQAVALISGSLDAAQIERAILIATMQYAKRQRTYFRRQLPVEWYASPDAAFARAIAWRPGA